MAEEGDWVDVLKRPAPAEGPSPLPDPHSYPEPRPGREPSLLAVFGLHAALGLVSIFLIGFGFFGWLDRLLEILFTDIPDTALFVLVVRHPVREEASKALVLGLGAIVWTLVRSPPLQSLQVPAFLVPALGIGMGFAVLETLLDRDVASAGAFFAIAIVRIIGHSLCVCWSAFGIALAVRRFWWPAIPVTFGAAILVHSGNNYLASTRTGMAFLWVFGWMLAFAILSGLLVRNLRQWPPRLPLP